MAMGPGEKGKLPYKSKPAKAYKVRPAVPPKAPPSKNDGCWLTALALISVPIGAVYAIVEVLT